MDEKEERICRKLDDLKKQLASVEETVAGIKEEMVEIRTSCPLHQRLTAQHQVLLLGVPEDINNNPGIVGRVSAVEGTVKLYNWGLRALWAVVAAMLITALTQHFLTH